MFAPGDSTATGTATGTTAGATAWAVPGAAATPAAAGAGTTAGKGTTATEVGIGAAAPPQRDDSAGRTVYLIHGYDLSLGAAGHDCAEYWAGAISGFRASGWRGELHTFGYYASNTNCDVNHDGDRGLPITEIGRLLAWQIYEYHSKQGKTVDLLAHSMGGLVARAALTGVAARAEGFPPHLYVEDVVTLSTPHTGTPFAHLCGTTQCQEMRPGSDLLGGLQPNPQSAHGTDWTLLGSDDDNLVSAASATDVTAEHKIVYAKGQGVDHSAITDVYTGEFRARHWHHQNTTWLATDRAAGPVQMARDSLYYAARW